MKKLQIVQIIPHVVGSGVTIKQLLASLDRAAQIVSDRLIIKTIIYLNDCPNLEIHHRLSQSWQKKGKQVECLSSSTNKGFTGAINDSYEFAKDRWNPDWYVVLNDDLVVPVDFYQHLLSGWRKAGPELISGVIIDQQQKVESYGLHLTNSGLAFPNQDLHRHSDSICGTIFSFSKKLANDRATLLDGQVVHPLLFAYHEDIELSLWTKHHYRRSNSTWIMPHVLGIHQGSRTAGRGSERQLYLGLRNTLYVLVIHWSIKKLIINLPFLFAGQVYSFGLSLYKRYWLMYPRILRHFWRDRMKLRYYRQKLHFHD